MFLIVFIDDIAYLHAFFSEKRRATGADLSATIDVILNISKGFERVIDV
jgi:hypothetical protein